MDRLGSNRFLMAVGDQNGAFGVRTDITCRKYEPKSNEAGTNEM